MRNSLLLISTVFMMFVQSPAPATQQPKPCDSGSACAMVQQALADSLKIKPGIKRKDVERLFKYDGGLQFPEEARYSYPQCDYIKLDVQYELAPDRGNALTSPDDTVTQVSNLYIAYPVKD